MPKKKSKNKKEKVDEEVLNELAESLKSVKGSKDEPEESELEDEVSLNMRNLGFNDFMLSSEESSPPYLLRH